MNAGETSRRLTKKAAAKRRELQKKMEAARLRASHAAGKMAAEDVCSFCFGSAPNARVVPCAMTRERGAALARAKAARAARHGMPSQCGSGAREKHSGSSTVMFPSSAGTIEKELSDGISRSTRLSSSMAASGSASGGTPIQTNQSADARAAVG